MTTKQICYESDHALTELMERYDRADILFEDMLLQKEIILRELEKNLREFVEDEFTCDFCKGVFHLDLLAHTTYDRKKMCDFCDTRSE